MCRSRLGTVLGLQTGGSAYEPGATHRPRWSRADRWPCVRRRHFGARQSCHHCAWSVRAYCCAADAVEDGHRAASSSSPSRKPDLALVDRDLRRFGTCRGIRRIRRAVVPQPNTGARRVCTAGCTAAGLACAPSPAATATPHRPVTPDAVAYRIVGRGGRDDLRRTRGCRRAGRICLSQQNRNWITQGRWRCHPGNDLALRHDPDRRPRPSCRYCRIHILDWRPSIALDDHRCAPGLHQRLVRRWGVDSCQPWRSSSAGAACRGGQHRGAQCDRLPTPIPG